MAVSKAHIKASRKYERLNPNRTGYTSLRRGGFNFANALNKEGSKSYDYITSDYAKEIIEGEERRITDLKDLTRYSIRALKALGVTDSEIKKLL